MFFVPAKTKVSLDKANNRMLFGVFLGYHMAPGGKWTKEYIIADLDDFVGRSLDEDASSKQH